MERAEIKVLIDSNDRLSETQRKLLRVLLMSENYFLPYAFNDREDFGKFNVIDKFDLIRELCNVNWGAHCCAVGMEEWANFIKFEFTPYIKRVSNTSLRSGLCGYYGNAIYNIDVYISYSDLMHIYKHVKEQENSEIWKALLREGDYND